MIYTLLERDINKKRERYIDLLNFHLFLVCFVLFT